MAACSRTILPICFLVKRSTLRIFIIFSILIFHTTVRANEIFAVGDIASCGNPPGSPELAMAAQTSKWVPQDADVLLLGDLVYPGGEKQYFDACYRPTWGGHDPHAYPTLGNHEYHHDSTASAYFEYFSARYSAIKSSYYVFERNHWLLLSLNSNLSGDPFDDQIRWLKRVLKQDSGKHSCILAFWHHPLYTSSSAHGYDEKQSGRLQLLWRELYAAHADLVLNGHDHIYESFDPLDQNGQLSSSGPREFIVGTGGAPLDGFNKEAVNGSRMRIDQRYAVLKLELSDNSYQWALVSDSMILDRGEAQCLSKMKNNIE